MGKDQITPFYLGKWREDPALQQASLPQATDAAPRAEQTRNNLCQYFMSDCGAVPSQRGNGSTQSEEPGSAVPLTGSPIAESPVCERTLTEVLDSRSSSDGTDRSRRLPAKRTKKGQHGAVVDEEVVLMRTIGETLERMAAGAQRQEEEHHAYLSVYCKRIEHRILSTRWTACSTGSPRTRSRNRTDRTGLVYKRTIRMKVLYNFYICAVPFFGVYGFYTLSAGMHE
ncbi:unnamed protein product [Arctogadus glacialis]